MKIKFNHLAPMTSKIPSRTGGDSPPAMKTGSLIPDRDRVGVVMIGVQGLGSSKPRPGFSRPALSCSNAMSIVLG